MYVASSAGWDTAIEKAIRRCCGQVRCVSDLRNRMKTIGDQMRFLAFFPFYLYITHMVFVRGLLRQCLTSGMFRHRHKR